MKRSRCLWVAAVCMVQLLFACQNTPQTNTSRATANFANSTDYVCGMKVQPDYTDTCHYQGKVYGFCSESCRDEFIAAPESFVSKETR